MPIEELLKMYQGAYDMDDSALEASPAADETVEDTTLQADDEGLCIEIALSGS